MFSTQRRNTLLTMMSRLNLVFAFVASSWVVSVHASPLSGTKSIGPSGSYASITAAITDIQTQTLGGALVLELQSNYVSTVETLPLVFPSLGATLLNTITLRPQSGAVGLVISSAVTTAATVDLNGASNVTIDGRPGGIGTASQLSITNTSTSGVALRFINEATSNTVRYIAVKGVNTSVTSGVVVFSTTTGANGNDSNTLDNCDIRDGASTPTNCLYSLGTSTTTAQNNSGNTVSNCNIFNFSAATGTDAAGVRLDGGNTDWILTGNSFYQTATRTAVASIVRCVYLNNTSGNNFTVSGNFIGGTSTSASGTAWTTTGSFEIYRFVGVHFNIGTAAPSSMQGNTLKNIVWSSGAGNLTPALWSGVYIQAGSVNLGTATGNIIGAGTGTGSISVTSSGAGTSFGISSDSSGAITIANGIIGSITVNGSIDTASLVAIQVTAGTSTISNNTIGSTITANSLNAATPSSSATFSQQTAGILSSSSASTIITGNTVANLNNNYIGNFATGQIRGIVTSSGVNTITGNTVRNLSTSSTNTNSITQAVLGISQTSSVAGQTVSQNTVHSLASTAASASVWVTGIYYSGPTTGANLISRNWVHSLASVSSSSSSVVNGMEIITGVFTAQNNMVRVGINASGTTTAAVGTVRGIYDLGLDDGRNFYHNSVYVGGSQTSGVNSSFAMISTGTANVRAFQNNIFVNGRSNNGATGKHYAVQYGGTTVTPAGLTAGSNILLASGTDGVLGRYNSIDRSSLTAWQSATGKDTTSAAVDPLFINITGNATAVDLHLQPSNPAEAGAVFIATVTDDFDGQTRSTLSPTDIGADDGSFTLSSDVFAPLISYVPLITGSTGNRLLTGFATIIDNVAVADGASAPRLYFKKSSDADAFGGNTAADNGWKFVTAVNGTSPFSFTIDYSLINGGGVIPGETVQYFVVAQDAVNNLSSSPAGAAFVANPPVQSVSAKPVLGVNSYGIVPTPLGTMTVGPSGNYASIGAAISSIQAIGLSGPLVLELQSNYVSTAETFPLVFSNLSATNINTVTLRPQSGAVGLVISSAVTTAATVDLNGASNVIIDGRPGGVGTTSQLSIANTSTSGVALRLINESVGNTVRYTVLKGVNTSANSGVVVFSTTTGANGNDNNTLDNCDIRDGASTPTNCIYALGSSATTSQNNSGITISNCNIFNYYSTTSYVDSAGALINSGNTAWTLAGNSFFQTTSRSSVGQSAQSTYVRAIYFNNASGSNFTASGNFIGGSAATAGGSPWTTTGTSADYHFVGIQLNVGSDLASNVQGNVIQNMTWNSGGGNNVLPGLWSGIHVDAGVANIGTVVGNTIGSANGTGSITATTSGSGGGATGIYSASSGAVVISNNIIGSITMNGTSTSVPVLLVGIQVTAGTNTISSNTIGSAATASSLNAATSASTFGHQVFGIRSSSSGSSLITGNIVANLNSNDVATDNGSQTLGIYTSAGVNTITGNTIRNISTTSENPNIYNSASLIGIMQFSASAGQVVSQNVVHSLINTSVSATVWVTGIYYSGSTSGTNVVARNWVHSLALSSSSTSSSLTGIQLDGGQFFVQNNMLRLGLNASGITTGIGSVRGIYDTGIDAGRNYFHNSVFIGGTETSGATATYAFFSSSTGNARTFQNNIFVNGRSNLGSSGKHYALNYGGSGVNPTGLTSGGNIFFVSGSGGVMGRYNSIDRTTIIVWRSATGQDATSAQVDPMFINAFGDAVAVNLHLQAGNPAESGALPVSAVTDDFDGQTRSSLTPTDIGADAGNFTSSSGDIFAPVITYANLTSGSTSNRVLTGFASVTDNIGVAVSVNAPRIYYKKSTDVDVFAGNTSAANGWKYVTASNSVSPFDFTIDYALIYGGSVSTGDTIQYFVVAQDVANNLGSSPSGASFASNPPVQNVNAKPSLGVKSYAIAPLISGTKTVGAGGDYPSLGGAGGLFSAINSSVVTGNLVISINGDLTENGSIPLNQFSTNEFPSSNYAVTIQPGNAAIKTISGNTANSLIRLNGADRVTIDGRFGGSGRFLTFRNSNTGNSACTILLTNDACNNTVRSCIVEGATLGFMGVIGLSTGSVSGNDNNLVTDNQVRDLSTAVGLPFYALCSSGTSDAVANSNNVFSNNEISNFCGTGIVISSLGNESWLISGNNIYGTTAVTYPAYGMQIDGLGPNVISENYIHDLRTVQNQVYGILFSGRSNTTISRNRITNFSADSNITTVIGIYSTASSGSTLNVLNNQMTFIPSVALNRSIYGLFDGGASGSTCNVFHNSILIGGISNANFNSCAGLRTGGSAHVSRNNIFFNNRTSGTGSHFAAGTEASGGSYSANGNLYVGSGATPTSFMDFNTTGTSLPVSFASWQASIGGDSSSQAGNAGGNFTTAMFVNAAAGDLHLITPGNPLVSKTGTPIAGVTTDFDGQVRGLIATDIGADELVSTNANLGALLLSAGTLSPTFNPSTLNYNATVSNSTASLTVTPSLADSNATATVNGVNAATPVALNEGSNTITILGIAQDTSSTKTYSLMVTRQTAFQTWAVSNGLSTDPLANGGQNLIGFAFGTTPSNSQLPQGQRIGNNFTISFTQPANATGITYGAEWSATLLTGSWAPISDTGSGGTHIFSVSVDNNQRMFIRLKVTAP
jgi:hypothetical protein